MRGRAERQHIEEDRLVIALVAPAQEAAGRLPAHADRLALVQRPMPVAAFVEEFRLLAEIALDLTVSGEIGGRRQDADQQQTGIDGRKLAVPGAVARLHIEEVIVEAAMASGPALGALIAVGEEIEGGQHPFGRIGAADPAALDGDRIARKRKADRGDAAMACFDGGIRHQSVFRIGMEHEIFERRALQLVDQRVVGFIYLLQHRLSVSSALPFPAEHGSLDSCKSNMINDDILLWRIL